MADQKYIYPSRGKYRVHIPRLGIDGTFPTLAEAIAYRDQSLASTPQAMRICVDCGKPFAGATSAKRCPDCRKVYQLNWSRRKAGWTEDEIAAGKRTETRVILPGARFGRLTVVKSEGYDPHRNATMYLCHCDCGKDTTVQGGNLVSGHTTSCGCALKDSQQSPEKRITALKASPNTGKFEQNLKAKSFMLSDGKNEYICRNLSNFCRENPELFDLPPGDDAAAEREAKELATSIGRYRCHGWTVSRVYDRVCQQCGKRFPAENKARFCPECKQERIRIKSRNFQRRNKLGWTEEQIAADKSSQLVKVLPPLLRPGGPFEFISQPDPRHYVAKCKRCGKVIERGASYFYSKSVVSCGCANAKRLNIQNKIDEKYIYLRSSGKYCVTIEKYLLKKDFPSLEEAVSFRDLILHNAEQIESSENPPKNLHFCTNCGKLLLNVSESRVCAECKKEKSIKAAQREKERRRDYQRRRAGWTEEEIRLGHRLTTKP